MEDYNKILDYVNSTCWLDNTETAVIIKKAHEVYNTIIQGKTRKKFLYRLCGQTGSG